MLNRLVVSACLLAGSTALAAEKPITDQQIKQTIDSHMGDIKPCLSADNGVAGGKLRVEILIEKDGHVSSTKVGKASDNKKIDSCIAAAIKKFTFPKPSDGQQWLSSYPFTFSVPKAAKVGTLTEGQITNAASSKIADFTACYDEAKKKKDDLAGQLELGVTAAPDGSVSDVEVLSSALGPDVNNCVVAKMKTVKFPAPTGGGEASFKYPMSFGEADKKKK